MKQQQSVLLAITGGKKSTVAAYLLIKQGFKVTGCTFLMGKLGSSCTQNNSKKAQKICQLLGIPHITIDLKSEFSEKVTSGLMAARIEGKDFNPCFHCNILKVETLLNRANELKIDMIATGHSANLIRDSINHRFKLYQGAEEKNDQTFFISGLREPLLEKLILPIGKLIESEIEKIVASLNFDLEEIKGPNEICMRNLDELGLVIEEEVAPSLLKTGLIVGEVNQIPIGDHMGFYKYKLGMNNLKSSGREISPDLCIVEFDELKRIIYVNEEGPFSHTQLGIHQFDVFLDIDQSKPLDCYLVIKPKKGKKSCKVFLKNNGYALVLLKKEIKEVIEPGELVVFYDTNKENARILGSGFITNISPPNEDAEEGDNIN